MSAEMDKYRDDYIREAREHVNALNQALLALEQSPDQTQVIDDLFRHAHTLKSMSAAMKYSNTEQLCHALEDVLEGIKSDNLSALVCIDSLFEACDVITNMIFALENTHEEVNTKAILQKLQLLLTTNKSLDNHPSQTTTSTYSIPPLEKVRTINISVDRIDKLMNLSEEFLMNKTRLSTIQTKLNHRELTLSVENYGRLINELQFLVLQARLVPLDYIFKRFPRMVRDIAKHENKTIDIQIQGASIELDRAIIDELGECLLHILKNAIDHGIESKLERIKLKKFEISTISINAERKHTSIVITISDDGAGLAIDKIRSKAEKIGLISPDAKESDIIQTIFLGLSTSDSVSHVSGRGFGLQIVKQKIESLGGHIEVKTYPGKGTDFILEIPFSIAIIRVLFVESNHNYYAIPMNNILRLIKVPKLRIKLLMNLEMIVIEEENIHLIRLSRLFNEPEVDVNQVTIVIIKHKDLIFGIIVDQFGTMDDIVIKPINTLGQKNRYFSGSTLMSNGQVSLILDVISMGQAVG